MDVNDTAVHPFACAEQLTGVLLAKSRGRWWWLLQNVPTTSILRDKTRRQENKIIFLQYHGNW